ncbi:MAG: carbamoyltransferase HypF [Oscillospiraceae bacterium]
MVRIHLDICGVVQGVGFRPFVHRLASECRLLGFVKNTSSGVELELEGESESIDRFISDVKLRAPLLADVESVSVTPMDGLRGYADFSIIPSTKAEAMQTLVSPDVGICGDCLHELFDPSDRRYHYPFINCTNCGPRFTIIKDVPYDRGRTTMNAFSMCPECEAEYSDIKSRRYHAQPDCCPICGPELYFLDGDGNKISGDPIETARGYLFREKIIAVKGLGGFHLACLPDEPGTVLELRRRKRRDEKPFALMCRSVEAAEKFCIITEEEKARLESFRRPIVLLKKRKPGNPHLSENGYLGVMLPYTPVHYLLMGDDIECLVMTSANISDLPIIYQNGEALEKLSGIADGFLLNNRDINVRCDDSLIRLFRGRDYPIRRSRGYVPFPIKTDHDLGGILSCGAEQKASFGMTKGGYFFLSGHMGDLKNVETFDNYTEQISHFERLFDIRVKKIVCDLHPDYMSTAYAEKRASAETLPLIRVQHHHAHMASCMADNGLDSDCIGVIWDGTGYGTDGTAWGGEILTGGYADFARLGTIRPIALPGGDRAVKSIWRIGYALLRDACVAGYENFFDTDCSILETMLKSGVNCPETTSIGRLFDGVAAVLDIKREASYEGQGAILLESAASEAGGTYELAFYDDGGIIVFDYRPMIRAIVSDLRAGVPKGAIAAGFMDTLVAMAAVVCRRISSETSLATVCLSGGVFQNIYLLERLKNALEAQNLTVCTHSRVSCNDEGISLGQAVIAEKRD